MSYGISSIAVTCPSDGQLLYFGLLDLCPWLNQLATLSLASKSSRLLYTDSYQIFHCVWMKGCSSAVFLNNNLQFYWAVVWWNQIIHNIRQDKDNSCTVISAIFACKLGEAVISVLTEWAAPLRRSLNRADAEKELRTHWSRAVAAITETLWETC